MEKKPIAAQIIGFTIIGLTAILRLIFYFKIAKLETSCYETTITMNLERVNSIDTTTPI